MMRIGCRAHDLGRADAGELARRVAENGFETVQLALTKGIAGIESFGDVTPERLADIRRGFDAAGVAIDVLGCYVEPGLSDREERLRQVGFFLDGLENAKRLGVPIVATETTLYDVRPEAEPGREAAYQNVKDSVQRMAERAEKLGVTIGIEPVKVHVLHSAALARRLLDEVGSARVKIVFDPVNMLAPDTVDRQNEIYDEFTRLLGRDICAVHAKDAAVENGAIVWRNIGKGVVDLKAVFAWLAGNAPDVPVLREEIFPDSAAQDAAALKALAGR